MKIAHICVYPGEGEKHISESGVASYTKNLLTNMPAKTDVQHYVLASRADGQDSKYQDGPVTVIRCFDKNFRFALQLNRQLKQLRPDVVHIQHELSLFGGLLTAYLVPLLVLLWRRKTTITLHGVVSPSKVDAAFIAANNYSAPIWAVRLGLRFLYWPLAHLPKKVVVHEPYFKHILVSEYGAKPKKISVIAHGVESFEPISKVSARKKLGIGSKKMWFCLWVTRLATRESIYLLRALHCTPSRTLMPTWYLEQVYIQN